MKLLSLARDLRRRKGRESRGLFVAEGIRAVEELLRSPLSVRGVLTGPQLPGTPRGADLADAIAGYGLESLALSEADFESATDTEAPQGVIAVAEVPEYGFAGFEPAQRLRLVILDAVQDPGNVGTIIRTAAALGASGVVAAPGTVDLWNAKVVRGAMGASFHFPAFSASWEDIGSFVRETSVHAWAADAGGCPVSGMIAPERLAIIMGNEGSGLSDDARQLAGGIVSLPIEAKIESLNVAVACGIILHQLRS